MTQLEIIRKLDLQVEMCVDCGLGWIPRPLKLAWLDWMERGIIPSEEELEKIIRKTEMWRWTFPKTREFENKYNYGMKNPYTRLALEKSNKIINFCERFITGIPREFKK